MAWSGESNFNVSVNNSFVLTCLNSQYDSNDFPIPPHVKIHDCVEGDLWSDDPSEATLPGAFSSYTSFELPVSSNLLLFLARGSTSHGNIAIITSDDVGDVAKVDVSVEYYRQKIRDEARVCLLGREEGETGVGIFVSLDESFRVSISNFYARPLSETTVILGIRKTAFHSLSLLLFLLLRTARLSS